MILSSFLARFNAEVGTHYDFQARQKGYIVYQGQQAPLMTMATGIISPEAQEFTDIREITEAAAEARRRATGH